MSQLSDDTPEQAEAAAERTNDIDDGRRKLMSAVPTVMMAGGLAAGYGTFFCMAGGFVYPARDESIGWQFLAPVDELLGSSARTYITPSGASVVIAWQGEGEQADDFIALSSICPHLGCQVHWEPHRDRFFCPCHNGVFDPQGQPLEGPPAAAGQRLTRFPLRIEEGLMFIQVPLAALPGQ